MWKFNFVWAWRFSSFVDTTQYGIIAVINCEEENYKRKSVVFNTVGLGFDRIEFWNHVSYHLRLVAFSLVWNKYSLKVVK
jgi:hypothetical protein